MPDPTPPRVTASRVIYENRWMRLREDQLQRADGSPGLYSVVEKGPAALVVPVEGDHVWLVEQYRHPVGRRFWEFPQGTLDDDSGAQPEEVARTELREETGLRAGTLRHLSRLYFAYGISNQPVDAWLATDLTAGEADLEPEEEGLRVDLVPLARVEQMVRGGEIADAASVAAWGLARPAL